MRVAYTIPLSTGRGALPRPNRVRVLLTTDELHDIVLVLKSKAAAAESAGDFDLADRFALRAARLQDMRS